MRSNLQRTLIIILSVLLGVGIGTRISGTKTVVKEVEKIITVEKIVTVPAALPSTGATIPAVEPTPTPVTWQQNPNNCNEATQWIAAEAPFYCIDKPVARKTVQSSSATTQASTTKANSQAGTCEQWILQAGVTDVANARELIRRESGCNPNAINKSSGACGVAQELPCGKSGCSLGDGACQVAWMHRYVMSRYKTWANAVAHHNANNWY